MTKNQILKRLTDINVIYQEPAKLFSKPEDNFYCNIKKACGYPDILNAMADLVGEKLRDKENCVAVSGYGGLPLGAVVASRFNRKLVTVRKTEKKYGPRGLIDGYIPTENDVVVIIDDVLATGDSIRPIIDSLQDVKIKISRVIFVVDIEKTRLPIPHESLFQVGEITNPNS